jgi:phage-related protein
VTGNGTLTFNNAKYGTTQTVTISNNGSSLIINSETQDAYDALGNNCNSKIQIPNGFPQLPSGDNTIVAS